MFDFFKKSIARKISIIIAISAILIFFITGFIVYRNTKTKLIEDIERRISLMSKNVVEDITITLKQSETITKQMAINKELIDYIKYINKVDINNTEKNNEITNILTEIKESYSLLSTTWVAGFDANYWIDNSGWDAVEGYDITSDAWYENSQKLDTTFFQEPYLYDGIAYLSCIKTIKENNKPIGLVSSDMSLDNIPSIMEESKIGKKGKNILVSANGTYIYIEDQSKIFNEKATDDSILKDYVLAALNGERDIKKVIYNGTNYYLAYEPIDVNGWAIISLVNEDEMMLPLKSTIFRLIIPFILGCLVLIALSYFAIAKNIKPIEGLVEASNKIAAGDIDVSIKSASKDEIGILSHAFEVMIENIKNKAYVAEKIASGDLSVEVKSKSDKDVLGKSMKSVVQMLRNLVSETEILTHAAVEGNFEIRGNSEKFHGGYKEIIDGINGTLDTVVEKAYWYEGILDSIPNPISVTDLDMNWTFINKAVTDSINLTREEVIGKQCSDWNSNICDSEKCGIALLRKNINETMFEQENNNFNVDTSYLYNKDGEKIGHIELIKDVTEEHRKKIYQKTEIERLAYNLNLLSEGNLNLNFAVGEADEYTEEDRENFIKINDSFKSAINSISTNVGELSHILSELSDGNLDVETAVEYKGDFAEIERSLNNIIDSLNGVLSDINTAAEQVASGSNQVSDSSMALSQGATEQASSVEQLTASIQEIASQTEENAQNANKAREITEEAKENAIVGNKEMEKMLKSMVEINEGSNNISKIIKVIDEIAFQTNILALNAAVEAARAGEHGKGFAVVAEEVRNLASRSANAAKETTELIEGSINKVEEGTKIANNTAEALHKIVEGASEAADLVGNIAIASNEQATGVDQVNKGVSQIANVVQTTSATSEETAAASEELSSQAQMLSNQVGKFKLKEKDEAHTYKQIEDLNPEVLKILEDMNNKNKDKNISDESDEVQAKSSSKTIELSDLEFGKY